LPEDVRKTVALRLFYDKRKRNGSHGRALASDFPDYGLRKGDRVEPTTTMFDVASMEHGEGMVTTVFWRPSEETHARHRNPLFSRSTGISIQNVGIDWMHTLSLGVFQFLIAELVWAFFNGNLYGLTGPFSTIFETSALRLKSDLQNFYTRAARDGHDYTHIQGLSSSMFGTNTDRKLGLHASETNGFLHFCTWLLRVKGHKLGPMRLPFERGLTSLVTIHDLIKQHPRRLPPLEMQAFVDAVCVHLQTCQLLGIPFRPKHHMLVELAGRFPWGRLDTCTVPRTVATRKKNTAG
jgi:hypothetical protein